jgi:Na+-driven multidrug efflux pump
VAILPAFSIAMLLLAQVLAAPLSHIFVGYDPALYELTRHGFVIFSFSFLFAGFAIFGSGFFTALNDGVTSAIISFLRTLVFQSIAVMVMPLLWDLDGIWWSVVGCEGMAMAVSVFFFHHHRHKFHYA